MKKYKKGFTIIESIIAISIFFIIINVATNLLVYSSNVANSIFNNAELLESANTCMDFIQIQVRTADEIQLTTLPDDSLVKLNLNKYNEIGVFSFNFYKNSSPTSVHYERLEFGDQELRKYIKDIKVIIDKERKILKIKIITADRTATNGKILEPVILYKEISINHKIIL